MVHRHCSIELSNNSNCYTLVNPRVFTEHGYCEVPFPHMVGPRSVVQALFNKSTGAAHGAVGVFTYDLFNPAWNDYNHSMAVMFSVPYDRNVYSNWCGVGIFNRGINCDYYLYDTMYNGYEDYFVRARADGSCISYEGDYIVVSASMSEAGEAVLRVDISETGRY